MANDGYPSNPPQDTSSIDAGTVMGHTPGTTGLAVLEATTEAAAQTAIGASTTGKALITAADAAAVRTAAGLGTSSTLNVPTAGDADVGEVVKGSDTRLTNPRTPTAHSQAASTISDAGATGISLLQSATADAAAAIIAPSLLTGLRNKIINGCFRKADYGTSSSTAGYTTFNRWPTYSAGSTFTNSQQAFTAGQTDVPGEPQYYSRTVVTSSAGSGNFVFKSHAIESVRTFAGKTATVSFYAKADSSKNISLEVRQYFGGGGSTATTVSATKIAITSSWVKYTVTLSVTSISGKTIGSNDCLYVNLWFDAGSTYDSRTGTLGQQSGTFEIADFHMIEGPIADTDALIPIGLLEMLCARYLPVWSGKTSSDDAFIVAQCYSATQLVGAWNFHIPTRVPPTGVTISAVGYFACLTATAAAKTLTTLAFSRANTDGMYLAMAASTGGLAAGDASLVYSLNANAKILATGCEL